MNIGKTVVAAVSGLALVAVLAASPSGLSQVFAQTPDGNGPRMDQHQRQGMRMGNNFGGMREALAQFLGMDSSQLRTERQSGKSMVQIAESKGKSADELYEFAYNQHKTHIDQLVADGKMTQEQADACSATMMERIKNSLNRTEMGHPGMGNRDDKGKGHGHGSRGNGPSCNGQSGNPDNKQ